MTRFLHCSYNTYRILRHFVTLVLFIEQFIGTNVREDASAIIVGHGGSFGGTELAGRVRRPANNPLITNKLEAPTTGNESGERSTKKQIDRP